MSKEKEKTSVRPELKVKGLLVENGVEIFEKPSIDMLSSRGYGTSENNSFRLMFHEALYLLDKGMIEIKDENGENVDFHRLLQSFKAKDENAWAKYLTYRDLRSRGYVVREGFGLDVCFRVYERGAYGKEPARYLILSIQEGKPVSLENLMHVLRRCQSLKKKLILAVMNRRGEIVYYSVSQLNLK
ncbi:MAG TPA: tRNA-intron lyase [Candidatus Bathyarchaeota archaeon]|nr:tRNA-intron lyase [Candidatus Bathyarchaeota archaeon]